MYCTGSAQCCPGQSDIVMGSFCVILKQKMIRSGLHPGQKFRMARI